jgi:hypothetical protein
MCIIDWTSTLQLCVVIVTVIPTLHRTSQEDRSVFWEVTVSFILSKKKVYMYMCPIANDFRDRAISLYSTLYTVQTSNTPSPHTSCQVH